MVIFFTHSSSMLLLYMSVDRAIAISVILRRNQITGTNKSSAQKSYSNTNKIVLGLFALISLLNVHFLFFTHLIPFEPMPPDNITLTLTNSSSPPSSSSLTTMTYHVVSNDKPIDDDVTPPPDDNYPSGICYGYHDTAYYFYLTVYFPW